MDLKGWVDQDTPENRKETPLKGMFNFLGQPIVGLFSVSR